MKQAYRIFAISGALIWSATIFLRGTALMEYPVMMHILWRTPNFGVVWLGVGLAAILYPHIFKREFNDKHIYLFIVAALLILLLSEIVHLWMDASFDTWDIVASIVAAIVIITTRFCLRRRSY